MADKSQLGDPISESRFEPIIKLDEKTYSGVVKLSYPQVVELAEEEFRSLTNFSERYNQNFEIKKLQKSFSEALQNSTRLYDTSDVVSIKNASDWKFGPLTGYFGAQWYDVGLIRDKVRERTGKFYGNYRDYINQNDHLKYGITLFNDDPNPLQSPLKFIGKAIWGEISQQIIDELAAQNSSVYVLEADKSQFKTNHNLTEDFYYDEELLKSYIGGRDEFFSNDGPTPVWMPQIDPLVEKNVWHSDDIFQEQIPTISNDRQIYQRSIIKNVQYNYKNRKFEKLQKDNQELYESVLPNVYAVYFENELQYVENKYTDFLNVNANINSITTVNRQKKVNAKSLKHRLSQTFYNNWVNFYDQSNASTVAKKYSTIIFDSRGINKTLNMANSLKNNLNYFIEISLPTDTNIEFSDFLNTSNIMNRLCKEIALNSKDDTFDTLSSSQYYNKELKRNVSIKSLDFKKLLKRAIASNETDETWLTFMGSRKIKDDTGEASQRSINDNSDSNMKSNLMTSVSNAKILQLENKYMRSYEELMEGNLAYSETICYKISKFKKMRGVGEKALQEIFIPNANNLNILRYVDSQIKYNKEYEYIVYAYKVVVGTKYKYVSTPIVNDGKIYYIVEEWPSTKLYEVPVYKFNKYVMIDLPPLTPEIRIVTYKDVSNMFSVFLNDRVGQEMLHPIVFNSQELDNIDKIREAYHKNNNEKIMFSGDDVPQYFEIYKSLKHPESWLDFKKIRFESGELKPADNASSRSVSLSIIPNQDHFYTFRTIDSHNNISNPSAIFRIRLNTNNFTTLSPEVEVVKFKEKKLFTNVRPLKRFVAISPTYAQRVINLNEDKTKMQLGASHLDDSSWGKQFRLNVISKSSGRKIEIYFKFDYETDILNVNENESSDATL